MTARMKSLLLVTLVCAGLGEIADEYIVHFACLFCHVDEGFVHCAGLLRLAVLGLAH